MSYDWLFHAEKCTKQEIWRSVDFFLIDWKLFSLGNKFCCHLSFQGGKINSKLCEMKWCIPSILFADQNYNNYLFFILAGLLEGKCFYRLQITIEYKI